MAHNPDAVIVNALVRQALASAEDVMGKNGLHTVLRASGLEQFIDNLPPDNLEQAIRSEQYARFGQAIEEFYGRGARGILRRIGQASFRYAIDNQPALMGIAGSALKLLPEKQRIKFVLNSMVKALKKTNSQVEAWLDEDGENLAYVESTCAVCHGRTSDKPICYLYVGSIEEAVRWATGKRHRVVETHCLAKGDDYCRFEVMEALD